MISVDLEDWYTSAFLRGYAGINSPPLIEETTEKILGLFKKKDIKVTFFVLGLVAQRHPGLIDKIYCQGHEIASHGYSHTPLWDLSPETFRRELKKTANILKEITGKYPIGFRAPYASIDKRTAWTVDILKSEGYKYDSSIFPMKTPLYGAPGAPAGIYRISSGKLYHNDPESSLIEIPFSVAGFGPFRLPCAGGIYGRFIPGPALKILLNSVARKRPLNFYFHPWEIIKPVHKIKVPFVNYFISYYNAGNYLYKIEKIISHYNFTYFEKYIRHFK